MRNLFIVSFLFLFFASPIAAQVINNTNDTSINYIDINNKKQGKWIKKYDDGQIRYKGSFLNDEPVGVFFYYHPDGSLKSVLDYSNKEYTLVEIYWPNGKMAAAGKYNKKRERIGNWKIYYEDGVVSSDVNYDNNIIHGFVKMFYPTGGKLLECTYNQGVITGAYTRYFENGSLHETGPYKDNMKEGYFKIYEPNNNISQEGSYIQGMRHGKWLFYVDGKISDTINYFYDVPDNLDEINKEIKEKVEWAKQNQDKFKQPEDYINNPLEFFKP